MGYCIDVRVYNLVIPVSKIDDCLKAINNLHRGIIGHYTWVNNPVGDGFPDLITALGSWRYKAKLDANNNVVVEYFTGKKLGDDNYLWEAIAPFVNDDAEVLYIGEDTQQWKIIFKNGKYKELAGKVIFLEELS